MHGGLRARMRILVGALIVALVLSLASVVPAMAVGATFNGSVIDASNGQPINDFGYYIYSLTTDFMDEGWSEGVNTFQFTGLAAGQYGVGVYAPGYQEMLTDHEFTASGTGTYSKTFSLTPAPPSIAGTVTDGSAQPVADVEVVLYVYDVDGWVDIESTFTDVDGTYSFNGLDPDTYRVGFEKRGYTTEYYNNAATLGTASGIVFNGTLKSGINASLTALTKNFTGSVYAGGAPAEFVDVEMCAYDADLDEYTTLDFTSTDEVGVFNIYGVDPQSSLRLLAWAPYTYEDYVSPTMSYLGGTVDLGRIDLVAATPVAQGTITSAAGGAALQDASVYLKQYITDPDTGDSYWDYVDSVSTAADGTYTVYGDGDGTYMLRAEKTGFQPRYSDEFDFAGTTVDVDLALDPWVPAPVARVGGNNRYDVAINLSAELRAKRGTPFTDVIVACGEDRAMADPLGAAALAAAYECPVLLTPSAKANTGTLATIAAMRNANGGKINIHVVGGTTSVPKTIYNQIAALKGTGTCERLDAANRYALAQKMAQRVGTVMAGKGEPVTSVMIVNIENSASWNDALAASPLSAAAKMPLIGVRGSSVPGEASTALLSFPTADRIAVNSAYLSASVRSATKCDPTPMATSANREVAATQIAQFGMNNGLSSYDNLGLANKLSDALPAGALLGQLGGALVYTPASPLSATTKNFATSVKYDVTKGWVFGGTTTIADTTKTAFLNALK